MRASNPTTEEPGYKHGNKLSRRLESPAVWAALLGFAGLLFVSLVTVVDILMRWVFLTPIHGFEDLKSLAFAVLLATSFPMVLLLGENVTIRFMGMVLPRRVRYGLEAFGAVLVLAFIGVMAWQFTVLTIELEEVGDVTITSRFTTWYWWLVATVIVWFAAVVQTIVCLGQLRRLIRGGGPGGTLEEDPEQPPHGDA